jgi:hypothetical protein
VKEQGNASASHDGRTNQREKRRHAHHDLFGERNFLLTREAKRCIAYEIDQSRGRSLLVIWWFIYQELIGILDGVHHEDNIRTYVENNITQQEHSTRNSSTHICVPLSFFGLPHMNIPPSLLSMGQANRQQFDLAGSVIIAEMETSAYIGEPPRQSAHEPMSQTIPVGPPNSSARLACSL